MRVPAAATSAEVDGEAVSDDPPHLGVHMLMGETLLYLLRRVEAGEGADDVYAEMYANADFVTTADLLTEGDEDAD